MLAMWAWAEELDDSGSSTLSHDVLHGPDRTTLTNQEPPVSDMVAFHPTNLLTNKLHT